MVKFDIPFAKDDAHAFLPWVIGIMVCMATLLLCLGVTLGSWVIDRNDTYSNSFTINIPANTDDLPAKVARVKEAVLKVPGVTKVSVLSDHKLEELLKPWLGTSEFSGDLPLPAVIDVTADGKTEIQYKDVQDKLVTIAAGTEVDAHERWVDSFSHFSRAMQALITGLATLIMGGLALMIAFTSRASLKLHSRTVHLLHSIGAEDRYITRQFQHEAFWLTLRGTLPGCLIAGIGYWLSGMYIASLEATILPALTITGHHVLLLLMMPLLCGGVAWMSARFSVLKQLRHVL